MTKMGKFFYQFVRVLLTLALVAACACMPFAAARWQDHRRIGRIERASIEPIALASGEADLLGRLQLCSQNQLYCEVQEMRIGTGVRYQEDTIVAQARQELQALRERDILDETLAGDALFGADAAWQVENVSLLADPGDPANNAMVWGVYAAGADSALDLWLDDATGKIVSLTAYPLEAADAAGTKEARLSPAEMEALCAGWAAYIGLPRQTRPLDELVQWELERVNVTEYKADSTYTWRAGAVTLHQAQTSGSVTYLVYRGADGLMITIA